MDAARHFSETRWRRLTSVCGFMNKLKRKTLVWVDAVDLSTPQKTDSGILVPPLSAQLLAAPV